MGADFIVHRHAARRWAERIDGIDPHAVCEADMIRASEAVALAMATARCVVRYGGSKRRLFVTPAGVHLLVAPGSVVISTFAVEWILPGCPCERCLEGRARELASGVVNHRRHGVLANLKCLKIDNHGQRKARRRHPKGAR